VNPAEPRGSKAAYQRLMAEAAQNATLREAESIVAEEWIARLQEAEKQCARAQTVITGKRDSAYRSYRMAEPDHDVERLRKSYHALAAAQQALGRIRTRHDTLRAFLKQEKDANDLAARARSLDAATEQEQLAAAALAAGIAVDQHRPSADL